MNNNIIKKNKSKIEYCKNIIKKFLFIIEFLVAIFCVYSLYKLVIYKNELNILPLRYLSIFIPTTIILISTIILNYIENKNKIEKIVISFLIPIGMLYVFFMAPSYVPDEQAHITKAYEISEGKLVTPIKEDGSSMSEIPKFFADNMIPKIRTYPEFNAAMDEITNYDVTVEIENSAQGYPAVLYIFSSIGFLIGRVIGINGILAIYLARILNFIAFLVLGYYSMKIIPIGKIIIAIILFLPMSLQQAASISADCILNAVSILYIAYTIYLLKREENISLPEKIIYVIMSIIIGISKIAYIPIVGLSLLFIGTKNTKKTQKWIFIILTILITIILSLSWLVFMRKYQEAPSHTQYLQANNVDMIGQIKHIIKSPKDIIVAITETIKEGAYLDGAIGSYLGWLNIKISNIVIIAFVALLALSPFLEKNEIELNKISKGWITIIAIGTYLLVVIALYLTWTPIGLQKVMGVQGRYFIPILALPLICLCKKDVYIKLKNTNLLLSIIVSILNVIAISNVIQFFIK